MNKNFLFFIALISAFSAVNAMENITQTSSTQQLSPATVAAMRSVTPTHWLPMDEDLRDQVRARRATQRIQKMCIIAPFTTPEKRIAAILQQVQPLSTAQPNLQQSSK